MNIKKLNEKLEKYIESGFNFTNLATPDNKEPKFKVGDEVTINGEKGEIIKVRQMKLSDTATYDIKLPNGKIIYRYEEEI